MTIRVSRITDLLRFIFSNTLFSGVWSVVKTEADERVEGSFNHWSYQTGWDMKTTKIRVELNDGRLDPWDAGVYFAIRQFEVMGVEHDVTVDISTEVLENANSSDEELSYLVDLKTICALDEIKFTWADGATPENLKVCFFTLIIHLQ